MQKAVIYHLSKKGTTKYFGEEIGEYLKSKNIESHVYSIHDYKEEQLSGADIVFLGAWTHGLFIMLQHPDKPWIEFAKILPSLKGKKIALFTTYKLATGGMFRKMEKHLDGKIDQVGMILKSKNDLLHEGHKEEISKFIQQLN